LCRAAHSERDLPLKGTIKKRIKATEQLARTHRPQQQPNSIYR
jgi:hypothetical protein